MLSVHMILKLMPLYVHVTLVIQIPAVTRTLYAQVTDIKAKEALINQQSFPFF